MNNFAAPVSPDHPDYSMSPPKYESMEYIRNMLSKSPEESKSNYPSMPLPPIPVTVEAPPLPARKKHGTQDKSIDDSEFSFFIVSYKRNKIFSAIVL